MILRRLDELMSEEGAPIRSINLIISDIRRRLERYETLATQGSLIPEGVQREMFKEKVFAVEAHALQFERESIEQALEHNRISRATAKQMRDNVAIMELDIEDQIGE
jgi:hypothetical protein